MLIIFPFLPVGWGLSLGKAQICLLFAHPNSGPFWNQWSRS